MAFFRRLDCVLCGLRKSESERKASLPVTRVHYEIEVKEKKETSSDSQESISSASQYTRGHDERVAQIKEAKDAISQHIPAPRTNRALVVASKGTYGFQEDPFPELRHDKEVIISNRVTGLNPIDYKSVDYNFCLPSFPWVTGREMSGVVEAVGTGVTNIKVGDHVWTSTYYRHRRAGTFQIYVTVPSHTALPLPTNLNFTSVACLGVAGLTAAMTLWRWLNIPIPSPTPSKSQEILLIWGGSTITGQFAIQLAKLSGLRVLAVTSEMTAPLVRELGAKVITRDGKSNDSIVNEIQILAGHTITKAIDLVGTETASYTLQTFTPQKGKTCLFAPLAMISPDVGIPEYVKVVHVEMKQFVNDELCRFYAVELNRIVGMGRVRMPDVVVLEGGLDVVVFGLERLKCGGMGGRGWLLGC